MMSTRIGPRDLPSPVPAIRYLRIERYRGIEAFEWRPSPGMNVLVGPGDTCKSTILEAIAALLTPAPNVYLSEFDYFRRKTDNGFSIEAAIAVGDASILKVEKFPPPPLRGWKDGQFFDLPDEDGAEAILMCRLTGTKDLEAVFEVVGADGESTVAFPRALRQRIGLLKFGLADRHDRDLRLVQGGALDRFMEGRDIRQTILQAILKTSIHDKLGSEPKAALQSIETHFERKNLPSPVRLGLLGTPGVSLAASVGLMIGSDDDSALPLPAWGTGTRRLASLELASILADSPSVAVIDEPESGLEPYRQRVFMCDLHSGGRRQAFIATHAPAILAASTSLDAVIWRIVAGIDPSPSTSVTQSRGQTSIVTPEIGPPAIVHKATPLHGARLTSLISERPEVVLARLPIICEGATEEGFVTRLLKERFGNDFLSRGIFCADAGGHDEALDITCKLIDAGFRVAALADDEGRKSGTWDWVGERAALLRWDDRNCLEVAVFGALPDSTITRVVEWPEEFSSRTRQQCLADVRHHLGETDKSKTADDFLAEYGRDRFFVALCQAACPPREGNKKLKGWFKSFDGGYLLGDKVVSIQPRPKELFRRIDAFLAAAEAATLL